MNTDLSYIYRSLRLSKPPRTKGQVINVIRPPHFFLKYLILGRINVNQLAKLNFRPYQSAVNRNTPINDIRNSIFPHHFSIFNSNKVIILIWQTKFDSVPIMTSLYEREIKYSLQ